MTPTTEELLLIARQYWRADKEYDNRPGGSPESKRFQALWRQELKRMDQWLACLRDIGHELPAFKVRDITSPCDSCFRCGAYPVAHPPRDNRRTRSEWVVVGCLSIMAPIYTVFGVQYDYRGRKLLRSELFLQQLPPAMHEPATVIGTMIERKFGVSALPPEIAATPIPLIVQWQEPPRTTLFHAMFTNEPDNVP